MPATVLYVSMSLDGFIAGQTNHVTIRSGTTGAKLDRMGLVDELRLVLTEAGNTEQSFTFSYP